MMDRPLLSIVMPNYNGAKYLKDSINSVISQTYVNWELLVVDDCSKDNSVEIIEQFVNKDNRIFLFKLNNNSGRPAVPRNIGIQKAKGEFIAFLDSDDMWHPEKLEIQMKAIKNLNSEFIASQVCTFQYDVVLKGYNDLEIKDIGFDFYDLNTMLMKNRIISGSSLLVNSSFIKKHNLYFIEDVEYKAVEDYWFCLTALKYMKNIPVIKLPLVAYRISKTSISKSKMKMAKRVYNLLCNFEIDGKKLGIRRYFYFLTYILLSVFRSMAGCE